MSEENVMTDVEYAAVQQQVVTLCALVADLPLENFLNRINHADTVGPILDPTLWMKGHKNMAQLERLARALLEVKKVAIEIRSK